MKKNNWIFLLFVVGLVFLLLSFYQMEPDYLWHVKAGEYMLHHGLLTKDVFSWSVYSEYWMSHEWLFEVLIAGMKRLFGNFHLFIYCFTCMFFLLLMVYFKNKDVLFHNVLFSILWFSCSIILAFSLQVRPHLLSNCLLGLTIWFLYDLYQNKESKKIYWLPLITIIWANVHGGSSNLPYLLCFLFAICGIFQFQFSKIEANRMSKKQIHKYLLVMLLCMGCVCINLHGFKMFLYPYQNMMDSTMIQNIIEWRSTSLNEWHHYLYYGLLLFIVCIFLFSKKKIEWMDFILLGFCAYLGLKSIRFWFYTYIIMSFVVFKYVGKRKMDKGTMGGLLLISCLLIGLFIFKGNSIFYPKYSFLLNEKDIQVIKEAKPERLFNMYNYGGDLVYNEIPVFIDGRADLYGPHNYKEYLNISSLKEDYVTLIKKYDFDYFLVDSKYSISTYLRYSDDYQLIYHRKNVYFYKKRTMES